MRFTLIALSCLVMTAPALAGGVAMIEGPVSARVLRIIDGDTLLVRARPWPQYEVETYVRLRGVDAPELKSPCRGERRAAEDARLVLANILPAETEVTLSRISGDKYFGRILADVVSEDGIDPASDLLNAGFVRRYGGGKRQPPACQN